MNNLSFFAVCLQGGKQSSPFLLHFPVMQTNSTLSSLLCSFNTSLYPVIFSCFSSTEHTLHYHLYTLTYLLLILPLYLFILCLGFQRWTSDQPASQKSSHADVFTYYMAAMDTLTMFGLLSYCCAIRTCSMPVKVLSYYCICIGSAALNVFHSLTCVERYLAVVHPIIYMKLKNSQGVRIRNICVALGLLLSFGSAGFVAMFFPIFPISFYFSIFFFIIMTVSFCSLAVFYALICSGMKRDQTKWRAFHTIMAITATLVLRFFGQTASMLILYSKQGIEFYCEFFFFGLWLCLPSCVVLPLLFLLRNGKLTCHKGN